MQRVEMEEVRQREANITALMAIGPRKKPRLDGDAPASDGSTVTGQLSQRQVGGTRRTQTESHGSVADAVAAGQVGRPGWRACCTATSTFTALNVG